MAILRTCLLILYDHVCALVIVCHWFPMQPRLVFTLDKETGLPNGSSVMSRDGRMYMHLDLAQYFSVCRWKSQTCGLQCNANIPSVLQCE